MNPVFVDASGRRVRATPAAVRAMTALLILLLGVTVLSLLGGVPMPGLTSPVRLPAGEVARPHDEVDSTTSDLPARGKSIDVALVGETASPPGRESTDPPLPTVGPPALSGPASVGSPPAGAATAAAPLPTALDSASGTSPTPAGIPASNVTPFVPTGGGTTSGTSNTTPPGRPVGLPTPANRPITPPGLSGNGGPGTQHGPAGDHGSRHGQANGHGPKS